MPRIMILSHYWYPENGVPQRRWKWLSHVLADSGHEIFAIVPPPHYKRNDSFKAWAREFVHSLSPTFEVGPAREICIRTSFVRGGYSLTSKAINQLWSAFSSIRVAFQLRLCRSFPAPELVLGTVPALPTAFASYAVARIFRTPHILDLRDAWPELLENSESWNASTGNPSVREKLLAGWPLQASKKVAELGLNYVIRHSEGVIVTTDFHRRDIIRRYKLPSSRVVTVRNVFPPAFSKENRHQSNLLETKEYTNTPSLNILYAGTVGRAQNLSNALQALRICHDHGVDARLRIIGAGAAKKQLAIEADRMALPVEILGKVLPQDLEKHYQWADTALVHLTDWAPLEKAVPSKTFELMALGIHISAAVRGETADLITELGAGQVVPPEDPKALASLWESIAQNPQMLLVTTEAKEWVTQEYIARGPKRFIKLIQEVIREKK